MIKLIVTADDYGMNSNCTKAITECMLKGWVTNTSLMVNMPSCEEAVEQARKNGLLDKIGLHLNFTEGAPLTERMQECREFCDEHGHYNRAFRSGIKRSWKPLGKECSIIVKEETEAQIKRYLELGLPVRHFDSHHHSHLVGRMIHPVFSVAEKYGFKSVRRNINLIRRTKVKSKVFYCIEGALKKMLMARFCFASTDYMCAYEGLVTLFSQLNDGDVVELMVHPMYLKDDKLDMSGDMSDSGLRSMNDVVAFEQSHSSCLQLISFKDVQR